MKENRADKIFIAKSVIDSVYRSYKHNRVAVLWSGGKDSTVLLHMMMKLYGRIPFKVVYGDLNFENSELSEFIGQVSAKWSFQVQREEILTIKEAEFFKKTQREKAFLLLVDRRYRQSMKTLSEKLGVQAFVLGNRRLENKKNSSFVKKTKRITFYYPFVQFSDLDMWEYIYTNRIPFLDVYRKGIRRTSPLMFLNKPSVLNRAAAMAMHAWFKIKFQILRPV